MSSDYIPRVADGELVARLSQAGAVCVEGPRACGKTETALQAAASHLLLDTDTSERRLAHLDPALALEGPTPRLVDEWQLVPDLWNAARRAVDVRRTPGQFIFTGSAQPADDVTRHSGAGRFSRLRMRPMSLAESGDSNAAVSLSQLLSGSFATARGPNVSLDDLIGWVCRGGWPAFLGLTPADAIGRNRDYVEELLHVGIETLGSRVHDPVRMSRVLASVARHSATEVSHTTLAADAGGGQGPHRETVSDYLRSLERLMVLESMPAWGPHLRSRARARVTPTTHLVDPSLAVAALRADHAALRADLPFFGLLFESMAVRDLRVYASPMRASVLHYRDSSGTEVDAIVDAGYRRWAAFEIKLGASDRVLDAAAAVLLKFASAVDTSAMGEPAALGVIVGTGHAYQRKDGVYVLPIAALGP